MRGAKTALEDYELRCSENGFMQRTNDILIKCGYHQLYAPNPYDSLLMCLVSSNEAINAFKNLWSWFLAEKENHQPAKDEIIIEEGGSIV